MPKNYNVEARVSEEIMLWFLFYFTKALLFYYPVFNCTLKQIINFCSNSSKFKLYKFHLLKDNICTEKCGCGDKGLKCLQVRTSLGLILPCDEALQVAGSIQAHL